MSEREFVDGAFYWVRTDRGGWTVMLYEPDERNRPGEPWIVMGAAAAFGFSDDLIGPMIGKEPPACTMVKDGAIIATDGNPATILADVIGLCGGMVDGPTVEKWRSICAAYDKPECENTLTPRDNAPKLSP